MSENFDDVKALGPDRIPPFDSAQDDKEKLNNSSLNKMEKIYMNKVGVKETVEFTDLFASGLSFVKAAKSDDGKVTAADFITNSGKVINIAGKVVPGFSGILDIPKELIFDEFTDEEFQQVVNVFIENGVPVENAVEVAKDFRSMVLEGTKKFVDKHIVDFM